jgi:hypothetical protein
MNISVFCGASLPRNTQFVDAAETTDLKETI